jgi:hypothetical protein
MFEKSLSETMPYSRDVAKALDIHNRKRTKIGDLLSILGTSEKSKLSNGLKDTTKQTKVVNDTPLFHNKLLSASGRIIGDETKVVQTSVTNSASEEAKDLLSRLSLSESQMMSSKADQNTLTSTNRQSMNGETPKDVDLQSIFAQMKSIQNKSSKTTSSVLEPAAIHTKSTQQHKEVRWTDPELLSSESSMDKKIVARASVVEKKKPKPIPISIMNGRLGEVMERVAPRPMSVGAMMLKQELVTVQQRQQRQQLEQDEEDKLDEERYEDQNMPLPVPLEVIMAGGGPSDIEGYLADLKHLRVAPSNSIRSLSYDPFAHWQQQESEEGVMSDEEEDEEDLEFVQEGDDQTSSLFLSVWSALDDLFSYTLITLAEDVAPGALGVNSLHDAAPMDSHIRAPIAAESQQVQHAIVTLLDRGIKNAEKALGVMRLLQTHTTQSVYSATKNRILSGVSGRLNKCPPLRSSGWTLIGLLLVDAVLLRKGLLLESVSNEVWTARVESAAAGLLGGGHIAGSMLRMDDMKILRSFFDQL